MVDDNIPKVERRGLCARRKTLRLVLPTTVLVAVCACDSGEKQTSLPTGPTTEVGREPANRILPHTPTVKTGTGGSLQKGGSTDTADQQSTAATDSADTVNVRALSVREQQASIVKALSEHGGLSQETRGKLEAILSASDWLSYGNPQVSKPSMTKRECRLRRRAGATYPPDPRCGAPNMVAIAEPAGDRAGGVCIDQFEFPNIECEYPVVWVRASEAAAICSVLDKRLCDAHEWEGACAGKVLPVDDEYPWARMPKGVRAGTLRDQRLWLEYEHNRTREIRWAYGAEQDLGRCATGAQKDPRCDVVDWGTCGTNSYPAGAFPECVSPFGVYDLHGNAAEHMNLPLEPGELTSRGGRGWTEMKGSWFIFGAKVTHPDDCRWRAKSWHTTRVDHSQSHRNYHLGFRCCKDFGPAPK